MPQKVKVSVLIQGVDTPQGHYVLITNLVNRKSISCEVPTVSHAYSVLIQAGVCGESIFEAICTSSMALPVYPTPERGYFDANYYSKSWLKALSSIDIKGLRKSDIH